MLRVEMNRFAVSVDRRLAAYLSQPIKRYEPFAISDPQRLAATLLPGDVLLVEGNRRISTAIKYLTQSTWSHAALYVGDYSGSAAGIDAPTLIEADIQRGVIAVPLTSVAGVNTRICRPVGLDADDRETVCRYAIGRLGQAYDLKNIVDLARYLLPVPPVPVYWRRRMLALGTVMERLLCDLQVLVPSVPELQCLILQGSSVREAQLPRLGVGGLCGL